MPTVIFNRIGQKLPSYKEALPVFSTILFIVFSWMFLQFFIQVPSWIFYMNSSKLLIMFSYVVSFSLVECLIMMGFVLFLCLIFPRRFYKDQFVAMGAVQVVIISVITYLIRQRIEMFQKFEILKLIAIPLAALAAILLSIILLSWLFNRFSRLPRWIGSLADRMTIFAYLYIPLGMGSLLLVILRNLT